MQCPPVYADAYADSLWKPPGARAVFGGQARTVYAHVVHTRGYVAGPGQPGLFVSFGDAVYFLS